MSAATEISSRDESNAKIEHGIPKHVGSDNSNNSADITDSRAFCEVLSLVDFPCTGPEGRPMSLIEVRPTVSAVENHLRDRSGGNGTMHIVVEIRPAPNASQLASNETGGDKLGQVIAWQKLSEKPPKRIKLSREAPEHTTMLQGLKEHSNRPTCIFEDPAVARVGRRHHLVGLGTQNVVAKDYIDGSLAASRDSILEAKNVAFQKMLKKLQGNKNMQDSDHGHRPPQDEVKHVTPKIAAAMSPANRPQANGILKDLRSGVKSDPTARYGNLTGGPNSEFETSAGYRARAKPWNPRAREFFSYNADQKFPDTEPSSVSTRHSPIASLFNSKENACYQRPEHTVPSIPGLDSEFPIPMVPTTVPTFPPLDPTMSIAGPGPYCVLYPNIEQLQRLGATAFIPPIIHGATVTGGPFTTPGSLPMPPTAYGHPNFAPVPPLASFQDMPNWNLGYSGDVARPYVVPKPRGAKPHPGDQQAYEAWIEWRKANEPGYAQECKQRQQRRAMKRGIVKMKPDTPANPEVTATA
ncbi:hypothetical protein S40288_06088 [Stachybotrys chartarum IBT 40288]|nr:hypothetical protein S40288_06088 [Stachybotrys chartarum IBT 40288]